MLTRRRRRLRRSIEQLKDAVKSVAAERLRAPIPRITPRLILLALLGVLLFLCGLVYGVGLIIRYRHHGPGID